MNTQEPNPMYTTPAHVSRISIARLFNLGDYEHFRVEITVEVPAGAGAAGAFQNLEDIIESLNPKSPVNEYNLRAAQTWMEKTDEQREQYAVGELGFGEGSDPQAIKAWLEHHDADARATVHEYHAHLLKRDMAIAALENVGGGIK